MSELRTPRVLLFTANLGYGGSESDFLRLAKYLSQRMKVTVALMARDYGSTDYSADQTQIDLPIVILDKDVKLTRFAPLFKALRWWRMLQRLRSLKRQHDVTISFLSGPNLLNALAGCPNTTIVSERGSKLHHVGIPPRTKWLWLRLLDPLTYRLASSIVPVSEGYAAEIAAIAGPHLEHKIVPIEGSINAADLITQTHASANPDIERFCAAPTAVCCGRLDRGKGIDLLIPVFARVYRQNPETRLLVIGDGPLHSALLDLCAAEGLSVTSDGDPEAAVFLAGYRSDPVRHFRLGRVFCFPSLHEGLPNALIEGIASGIPVLAADCPWGPRSILAGPGDVAALRGGALPLSLAHGTLMPLPDTPAGAAAWEVALCEALVQPARRRSPETCRAAIARFDIDATGPRWVELIYALASTAASVKASSVLRDGPSV
jgi:glycosyltransferase involved in cell wall biosynthesis